MQSIDKLILKVGDETDWQCTVFDQVTEIMKFFT